MYVSLTFMSSSQPCISFIWIFFVGQEISKIGPKLLEPLIKLFFFPVYRLYFTLWVWGTKDVYKAVWGPITALHVCNESSQQDHFDKKTKKNRIIKFILISVLKFYFLFKSTVNEYEYKLYPNLYSIFNKKKYLIHFLTSNFFI